MRHMGGVRIVVSPDYRRHGLARLLANEIFDNATDEELEKLTAEVVADQKAVLEVFSRLGFREEAIMRDYILDAVGNRQDLVIKTRDLT
jgi:ribosomal protein S18 acetylase RimI-like enzyme